MIHTYNEYHLGDNLIHLHYLRMVCKQEPLLNFVHHCNPIYHSQLEPLCEGVSVHLQDLSIPPKAHNAWIGYKNFFYHHGARRDWVAFHLSWYDYLSDRLEVSNPIACKEDLLFEYPALKTREYPRFDWLIVNSPPQSGQLPDYSQAWFIDKAKELCNQGLKVITTYPTGVCESTLERKMTVTDIGNLSLYVDNILGVDTGPMWTTHNIYNQDSVLTRCIYTTAAKPYLSKNTVVLEKL
jgi:hypothetical protein